METMRTEDNTGGVTTYDCRESILCKKNLRNSETSYLRVRKDRKMQIPIWRGFGWIRTKKSLDERNYNKRDEIKKE